MDVLLLTIGLVFIIIPKKSVISISNWFLGIIFTLLLQWSSMIRDGFPFKYLKECLSTHFFFQLCLNSSHISLQTLFWKAKLFTYPTYFFTIKHLSSNLHPFPHAKTSIRRSGRDGGCEPISIRLYCHHMIIYFSYLRK